MTIAEAYTNGHGGLIVCAGVWSAGRQGPFTQATVAVSATNRGRSATTDASAGVKISSVASFISTSDINRRLEPHTSHTWLVDFHTATAAVQPARQIGAADRLYGFAKLATDKTVTSKDSIRLSIAQ